MMATLRSIAAQLLTVECRSNVDTFLSVRQSRYGLLVRRDDLRQTAFGVPAQLQTDRRGDDDHYHRYTSAAARLNWIRRRQPRRTSPSAPSSSCIVSPTSTVATLSLRLTTTNDSRCRRLASHDIATWPSGRRLRRRITTTKLRVLWYHIAWLACTAVGHFKLGHVVYCPLKIRLQLAPSRHDYFIWYFQCFKL